MSYPFKHHIKTKLFIKNGYFFNKLTHKHICSNFFSKWYKISDPPLLRRWGGGSIISKADGVGNQARKEGRIGEEDWKVKGKGNEEKKKWVKGSEKGQNGRKKK